MEKEIVVALISAIGGGIVTIGLTYNSNKSKRFELEHNYRTKMESLSLENARKHLDDIYVPIYSKIVTIENLWNSTKEKDENYLARLINSLLI